MSKDATIITAPVFPLNTVLFPRMPLPLQIFEPRYKTMLTDIARRDNRFAVALIENGVEVGGNAVPYSVACLAEVTNVQRLSDGRFLLMAQGVARVRILSTDDATRPYLVGSMQLWPEEPDVVSDELVERAAGLFAGYAADVISIAGEQAQEITLPGDPSLLSYVLAAGLQIDVGTRQRLLETAGPDSRLRTEVSILEREALLMHALAAAPRPPAEDADIPFSRN
jgi:Lon protease-like protein